ncbi:MAG TPA: hypothetical protein VN796_00875 [Acidimicrobiales bacterium]|nr:hypothetical protein [Acidimicrobiales bacterium]
MTLLGVSGAAQAKTHPRHHHHHGGGGGTGGTGPPLMVVSASPNPVVDTGGVIMTVVQVETNPSLAGDMVNVSSSQLADSCLLIYFVAYRGNFGENVDLTLDNEGNATVEIVGEDCAPGPSLIEADLVVAPYYTATTTLQVEPPVVSTPGVTGYPNPEVETGEDNGVGNNDIGNSDVFAVFEIEASPVYAEQTVEISSAQLEASCQGGWVWISPDPTGNSVSGTGVNMQPPAQALLDDDGNAVFGFYGRSCAAGPSVVLADVAGGTNPTYVTTYTVSPPAPTI